MKKYLFVLILLPSLLQAQSRYLKSNETAVEVGYGAHFVEHVDDALLVGSLGYGADGRFDLGIQYGKNDLVQIISPYINFYVLKQQNISPVSVGVTLQLEMSRPSHTFYNPKWSNFITGGFFIESNLIPNSQIGVIPFFTYLLTDGELKNDGFQTTGFGMSVVGGKNILTTFEIGYYTTELASSTNIKFSVLFK